MDRLDVAGFHLPPGARLQANSGNTNAIGHSAYRPHPPPMLQWLVRACIFHARNQPKEFAMYIGGGLLLLIIVLVLILR
jgi:hypothetical protein